jgi:surface antigen
MLSRGQPGRSRPPGLTRLGVVVSALTLLLLGIVGFVATPASATIGTNDYPTSIAGCRPPGGGSSYTCNLAGDAKDADIDPWSFFNRECTSFVAWRLNNDNGVSFTDGMTGPNGKAGNWGNASNWSANATYIGYTVNNTPAIGSVAYWAANADSGYATADGHVSYVDNVSYNADGTVESIQTEDYNALDTGLYSTHDYEFSPTKSADWPTSFIHIKDLSSAPNPTGMAVQEGNELYWTDKPGDHWEDEGSSTYGYWAVAGQRLAKYASGNGLYVTDNPGAGMSGVTPIWTSSIDGSGSHWEITPNLIAVQSGNTLYVTDKYGDGWVNEGSVTWGYWAISGDRLAKYASGTGNGLFVTDTPLSGPSAFTLVWANSSTYPIDGGGAYWEITPNLIAVQSNNVLYATGAPGGTFIDENGATWGYWAVSGGRLANFNGSSGGGLAVTDNPTATSPTWYTVWGTNIDGGGQDFEITPNLIAVQESGDHVIYTTDKPGDSWQEQIAGSWGYWGISGNRMAVYNGGSNMGLYVTDDPGLGLSSSNIVWSDVSPSYIDISGQAFSVGSTH